MYKNSCNSKPFSEDDLEGKLVTKQNTPINNQQAIVHGFEALSSGFYMVSYTLDGVQGRAKMYKK